MHKKWEIVFGVAREKKCKAVHDATKKPKMKIREYFFLITS